MNVIKANLKFSKPLTPLNLDKVAFIVLHHIAAKEATPEKIHEWHLKRDNGTWAGFGYNEYIRKDGTVYIGRGDNIGAQTKDINSKSYGIAVEGNYDEEKEMPKAQFYALIERIKYNKARFKNLVEVAPHKKFNPTNCPGKHYPLDAVLKAVEQPNYEEKYNNLLSDIKKLIEVYNV